jgi:tRNA(Ile2) C34 agmatinyltransferase TiaS
MAEDLVKMRPCCPLCAGGMEGSFIGEDALFKCRDCSTTMMVPSAAWDVAAAKRTGSHAARKWSDDLPIKAVGGGRDKPRKI